MRDLAQNSSKPVQKGVPEWPSEGVSGALQTPDPLIGCGLLSISSVVLGGLGPWEGVQNDPFLDPLLSPPGQNHPNNTGEMRHFWPGPAKRVKKGYPKMTQKQLFWGGFGPVFDPFLDPLLDPPGQKGPNNTGEMRHFWPGPAKRVKKGYPQNGSFWTPPRAPGGPK